MLPTAVIPAMTTPQLVVPIRSFRGFTRLSSLLDPREREMLAVELANRLRTAAAKSGLRMTVVSGSIDVQRWADQHGVSWIEDPGHGLDAACEAGTAGVSVWLVVHADLPGIDAQALTWFASQVHRGIVIAPSADGGTNAIGGDRPVRFSFGPSSFHRHLAAHPDATVVTSAGLCIEVDTPEHLRWLPAPWQPSTLGA